MMRSCHPLRLWWVTCLAVTSFGCTLDTEGGGLSPDGGTAGMAGLGGMGGTGAHDASSGGTGGAAGTSVGGTGGTSSGGSNTGGTGPGGASGAGGTDTGGTGGALPVENCADGIDNNGDGAADCLDDECHALGYVCAPGVPEEWTGFFRVRVMSNAVPAPVATACPGGGNAERYFADKAGPATCEPCACGPLEGAVCGAPGIACDYESSECANVQPRPELADFGCHNLSGSSISCRLTGVNPVSNPGACAPSPTVPDFLNKPSFNEIRDACFFDPATDGTGCGSHQLCVAPGSGDYGGALCIMQPNDQAVCPPQWDLKQPLRLYKAEDTLDDRGCEPCTCTPDLTEIKCVGGSYEVYDRDGCDDCESWEVLCEDETNVTSSDCKNLSSWADYDQISIEARRPQIENGMCKAGGGKATGFVQTTKGVTFCCISP